MKTFYEFASDLGMTEDELRAKLREELPAFVAHLQTIHVPDNLPDLVEGEVHTDEGSQKRAQVNLKAKKPEPDSAE